MATTDAPPAGPVVEEKPAVPDGDEVAAAAEQPKEAKDGEVEAAGGGEAGGEVKVPEGDGKGRSLKAAEAKEEGGGREFTGMRHAVAAAAGRCQLQSFFLCSKWIH
ncbi:hypothetical protein E2562_027308 [Oryza meyeriana var. granulata]|uniref:Uncharacterized protein n=1 Tax=Oryza meyeriana var. granulata TaxID=110450 RepID=A0A6G1C083_9ORYZ|nr:hypothetical protein E2562_027308 [Oryza meyeriana var. granulata]